MSRLRLAFACFFSVLRRKPLPAAAAASLGEPQPPVPPQPAQAEAPSMPRAARDAAELRNEGILLLLSLFQREGRLLDFLRESIDAHADADIGAAARAIHAGCRKVLDQHVKLTPVMSGEEEAPVTVPRGFNPGEVQLVGGSSSAPPFTGTLLHHGWRAVELHFPSLGDGVDCRVLAPAEVRVP